LTYHRSMEKTLTRLSGKTPRETGLMAKRCERGKSCGATCISGSDFCQRELAPKISNSLSKASDYLVQMRDTVISGYQPLVTPEQTAKWLLEHQEELATWGMTDFNVNQTIAQRPAFITFGVEPGIGKEYAAALLSLRKTFKELERAPKILDSGTQATGAWGDQILKANTYKLVLEGSPKVKDLVPNLDPKRNELLKSLAAMGMNVDIASKESYVKGLIENKSRPVMAPGGTTDKRLVEEVSKPNSLNWGAANGLIMRGAGVAGQGVAAFNPSGLWKPSKNYGQFKEVFRAAGYNQREMGPFASNGRWYKYSSEKMGDQVMKVVREAQPKLMYFGGEESARVRDRLSQEFPQRGKFTLNAPTKDGKKNVSKNYEYFLYPRPDGTHTVAMFGPHPGAMGMGSNRNIMEGTGEVAKALHETGTLPQEMVHGYLSK
jgi:hypothetical protein